MLRLWGTGDSEIRVLVTGETSEYGGNGAEQKTYREDVVECILALRVGHADGEFRADSGIDLHAEGLVAAAHTSSSCGD